MSYQLVDKDQILSGTITDAHLEYLNQHARAVKNFTCTDSIYPSSREEILISPSTYIRIAQISGTHFLPCLESLRFPSTERDRSLGHLFIFLSSSLRSVEIESIRASENHFIGSFVSSLCWEAPALRRLVLRGPGEISQSSLKYIALLTQLDTLELPPISGLGQSGLFRAIGSLDHLEILIINGRDKLSFTHYQGYGECPYGWGQDDMQSKTSVSPKEDAADAPEKQYFLKLKTLEMNGPTALVDSLLKRIASPHLSSIHISLCAPNGPGPSTILTKAQACIIHCFQVMGSNWSKSLRSVVVDLQTPDFTIPPQRNILDVKKVLSDLRLLNALEVLDVRTWKLASFPEELEGLARSWPLLKEIRLPVGSDCPPLFLDSFYTLARHCPDLQVLQCMVDLDVIPSFPLADREKFVLSHELKVLSVGTRRLPSDHRELLAVARYLDMLFPHLQDIIALDVHNSTYWQQIRDTVKMYQHIRDDEKHRSIVASRS